MAIYEIHSKFRISSFYFLGFFESLKCLFTGIGDHPLIVQFAAKEAQVLCDAARIVCPFADGIDLNCGCPQR